MKTSRACRAVAGLLAFCLASIAGALASDQEGVRLRSGVVRPGGAPDEATHGRGMALQRWVVRMAERPGLSERAALERFGARVDAPLPDRAYLVSVPAELVPRLTEVAGVAWAAPFLPQHKISPQVVNLPNSRAAAADDEVAVVAHLFSDADPRALRSELEAEGMRVTAARGDSRFGRIVLLAAVDDVSWIAERLAGRNDVFWVDRRRPRRLANDTSIWVGQSGLDAGQTTPIFDQGITGAGQIAAVLDTGLDADSCFYRDEVLGLPPTNLTGGTVTDPNQRKVIAVDFLHAVEDPSDPTDWDTQGHGTHVTGTLAGDNLANPIAHDTADGMAPGAKLVIQDAGYAPDSCGDLPGIGCPVADLNPVFQQAYDQGARVHNNSWNDNENAAVQNNYSDASQDVDEFMWNNPDFLIVFAAGNDPLGGVGTIGSPSTAKNTLAVGATFKGTNARFLSDISAWGPTDDGRIKPDVVFPGASIVSSTYDGDVGTDNCTTGSSTGTSMAAPGAAGMALLTREYFADGWYPSGAPVPEDGFEPSAALVKAMLINSAVSIDADAESRPITIPSNEQGWGRILLDNVLHFAGETRGLWVDDHASGFVGPADEPVVYMLEVTDSSEPLKITLAWTDYPSTPAAAAHLVNDLDLRVDGPGGGWRGNAFRGGRSFDEGEPDRLNNVEQVFVPDPEPGVYSIRVSPWAVPSGPQPWSLVVTGNFMLTSGPRPGHYSHVIDDSAPLGNGDGVLDPGESAIVPVTLVNSGDADAFGVSASMHSRFPSLLKVYGSAVDYGDIPAGEQKSAAGPHYEVTLEPAATCAQILGVGLGLTGVGIDQQSGFTIPIGEKFRDMPSTDTPLEIPRNDAGGVWSYLSVPDDFSYNEVDVTVNIDHNDISELQVLLYAPDNAALNLHRNTDPGVSGIHTTYDDETFPAGPGTMETFLDRGPSGSWRLRAIDATSGGTPAGQIQSWTLHFKSDEYFDCNPVSCGEPVPPAVGSSLLASKSGSEDVSLSWTGVGGASNYNVWRSEDARFLRAVFRGETGGATSFVDAAAQSLAGMHYYLVRSVNSCRWESQ